MNTKIVRRILPAIFALLLSAPLSAQWTIPVATSPANSAVDLGNGCFQMTSNLTSQRGVVWNNTQLNLNNPFDITLTVTMTGNQFGADGLAFILQNSGLATFGPGARSLGYLTDGMLTGISPSIGVEMDLRPNGGFGNDNVIPQDHVALHENGNPTAISGPVQALLNGGDISTGVCHELRILWTPPTTMTVQVDGNTLFTRTNNLVTNIFGGNPNVFWGFAGSTGGSVTNMVICANAAADFADAGPDTTICLGSTLQLQASGGLDYAWTDPLTLLSANNIADPTFTPAIPGIFPFPLTVTNNACSDTNIVLVTVTPPPTAAISTSTGDTLLCTGDTLLLTASGGGDYAWSTPASTATISVTNPGTYTVTVTDNSTPAACADTTAVTILGVTPPVADAGANDTICVGDTITVGGVSSTGPNIVYTWTPTAGLSNPSIAQPQAFPTATTTYTLTVDSAGVCSATDDITITVQDTPLVSVTPVPDSICAGQSAVLTSSVSGGAGGYLYAWSSGGTGSNEPVSPLTTTSYALTVTDANGCAGDAFATVIVSAQDSIDITVPDTFTCNGGSIDITNTFDTGGIDTWQWSPTTGVSNPSDPNSTITPPTSTTYFLSGLNSQTGCGYTDSIQIDAFDLVVNYWTDSTVCLGDTVEFDIQPSGGSGNYSYLWLSTTSDTVVNDTAGTTLVGPTVDGMFTVLVTDNVSGCNTQFSINLEVTQLDVMAFPQSELINPGQRVELLATGAITYVWSPDTLIDCSTCPDPVVKPNESTNYTVVGTDTNGCRGTATVVISVDSFLVPNVFTPNNDGINDVLLLNYYGEGDYEIAVFDRWGKQIYSTTDTDGAWNGRNNNGEEVPEGVYYLVVRVVGDFAIPDKDKQRVFNVTLMR